MRSISGAGARPNRKIIKIPGDQIPARLIRRWAIAGVDAQQGRQPEILRHSAGGGGRIASRIAGGGIPRATWSPDGSEIIYSL